MAFKELCSAVIVFYIISFIIGAVEANVNVLQEPEKIQSSTSESNNISIAPSPSPGGFELNNSSGDASYNDSTTSLEDGNGVKEAYAVYFITPAWFTGFTASMTVYNPKVLPGQMSKTYISIQNTFNKPSDGIDEIQAGWIIDPWKYGDSRTRFFISYKGANGKSCINLCRDGFRYFQGSYLAPGDVMDADNHITIKFLKDNKTGDWGLFVGPGVGDTFLSQLGYFPKYLFTGLASSGNYAEFGGAVRFINSLKSPPMGNGVYAKELQPAGGPQPAVMTNVYYIRPDGWKFDRNYRRLYYPRCYGLGKLMIQDDHFGYGGPGGCS